MVCSKAQIAERAAKRASRGPAICGQPGCNRDISHLSGNAERCGECATLVNRLYNVEKRQLLGMTGEERKEWYRHVHERQKSELGRVTGDNSRVAQPKCWRCGGMPWAREEGRTCDQRRGPGLVPVSHYVQGQWRCIECDGAYEAEAPPERPEPMGSSAAFLAATGELFGCESRTGHPSQDPRMIAKAAERRARRAAVRPGFVSTPRSAAQRAADGRYQQKKKEKEALK